MTTPSRWDAPWASPTGSAPERGPGEPGPGLIAVVSLATLFGANVVGALLVGLSGRSTTSAAVGSGAFTVVAAAAGFGARSRRTPLLAWVADLAFALAAGASALVGYWGAQAAATSDDDAALTAGLVGTAVALALYVVHRRPYVLGAVAGLATLLVLALFPDQQAQSGTGLLVLAGVLALAAASGMAAPPRAAFVFAAIIGGVGCQQVLRDSDLGGALAVVALLGLIGFGVLRANRSLLPVAVIAGAILLPQVLSPVIGDGSAFTLSMTFVAASVAWLATDLARRAVRPVQTGGVWAFCLVLLLLGQASSAVTDHHVLYRILHAAGVVAFFAAAASSRRRPATVISGLFAVSSVSGAVGTGTAAESLIGLVALVGGVAAAIALDRRAPRPSAAPYQQEVALSGAGRDWTVVGSYEQVFDTVVACFSAGAVPLQLVDRAAGRVVAGELQSTTLTVAIWATDPVQTHLRAVGQPADVDRLEAEVAARLKGLSAPH